MDPAGNVAHDHFQRNNLDRADQLLAHVDALDEMRGHPDLVQPGHDKFRQHVVQHALAIDHVALFRVEGGGIIFEILHQRARFGALIENLGLALINFRAGAPSAFSNRCSTAKCGVIWGAYTPA